MRPYMQMRTCNSLVQCPMSNLLPHTGPGLRKLLLKLWTQQLQTLDIGRELTRRHPTSSSRLHSSRLHAQRLTRLDTLRPIPMSNWEQFLRHYSQRPHEPDHAARSQRTIAVVLSTYAVH